MRINYRKLRNKKIIEIYHRLKKFNDKEPHIGECLREVPIRLDYLNVIESRSRGINPIVSIRDFDIYEGKFFLRFQYVDVKRTNKRLYFKGLLHKPKMSKKYLVKRN